MSKQVFWLSDQPECRAFPAGLSPRVVAICNIRPRLQRRARHGFAPGSIVFQQGDYPRKRSVTGSRFSLDRMLLSCAFAAKNVEFSHA